jgi:hypothetical protein
VIRIRAAIAILVAALSLPAFAMARGDDGSGGGGGKKHRRCVVEQEARMPPALRGDDEGPPTFTAEFYEHTFKLDASTDGLEGDQLPISIETVCRVPRALAEQAAQLSGGDGLAKLTQRTRVFKGHTQLEGDEARRAVEGADTVTLNGRLLRPGKWGQDEDGGSVPTFKARKITVTD